MTIPIDITQELRNLHPDTDTVGGETCFRAFAEIESLRARLAAVEEECVAIRQVFYSRKGCWVWIGMTPIRRAECDSARAATDALYPQGLPHAHH